jgi:hypothetical protein
MPRAALWALQCIVIKWGKISLSFPARPFLETITGAPSVAKKYNFFFKPYYSNIFNVRVKYCTAVAQSMS